MKSICNNTDVDNMTIIEDTYNKLKKENEIIVSPFQLYNTLYPLFTEDECNNIVKFGYERITKGNIICDLPPNEITNFIYNRLRDIIIDTNNCYWKFNLYDFAEQLKFIEYNSVNTNLSKLCGDIGNNLSVTRKLTIVVQLSNDTDYEGGNTILFNYSKPLFMTRKKGCVSIYPTYMSYQIEKIIKGVRNVLIIYAYGPPLK